MSFHHPSTANPHVLRSALRYISLFPAKTQACALLCFQSVPKMASIASFKQFLSNPVCKTSQRPQFNPKVSNHSMVFTHFWAKQQVPCSISIQEFPKKRTNFVARVAADDEWGAEKDSDYGGGVAVVEEEEPTEIDILKKKLVGALYGTNRGLSATSETRAEIVELISQLEAKNPTPAPTEALTLLNGKWILAYTSFVALFPLLSRGTLPLVKVEEISQTIDSENFSVQNCVLFSGPLASTSITTTAKFEVRSPKRVQIKFEEGIIGTPQLTDSIVVPENVEILGQKIDLAPFKGILTSVQDTASSVVKSISNRPPLKFSLSNRNAESWLLTTFLDHELRISRGDGGSVFVLIKEGSPLLTP